jgi:hypothetical protein
MTIAGDLHVIVGSAAVDKSPDEIVRAVFDFMTDCNVIAYLISQECDVSAYCEAMDTLKRKCL